MQFNLPIVRIAFYGVLSLFSFILFCVSAARINFTNSFGFYEPIVVELLVTTIFTMPWCVFIVFAIHKRFEHPYFGIFATEIAGLVLLWFFWIIGAASASTALGMAAGCGNQSCSLISAVLAFAWLGWITLSVILGLSLLFSFANTAFREPMHGRWDPRISTAVKA